MLLSAACTVQETPPPRGGFESEITLENEYVRAVELEYEPGGAASMHTHEYPRVVYVLDGGTLEMVSEAADTARLSIVDGQTIWRPAETHSVRNVGTSTVRVLETEVKPTPAQDPDEG